MGEPILTPENTEKEIAKEFEENWDLYDFEDRQQKIREALKKGMSIYSGTVMYEDAEDCLADIYGKVWEILDQADNFEGIDTDLSY